MGYWQPHELKATVSPPPQLYRFSKQNWSTEEGGGGRVTGSGYSSEKVTNKDDGKKKKRKGKERKVAEFETAPKGNWRRQWGKWRRGKKKGKGGIRKVKRRKEKKRKRYRLRAGLNICPIMNREDPNLQMEKLGLSLGLR